MSDLVTVERAVYGRQPEAMALLCRLLLGTAAGEVVVDRARSTAPTPLDRPLCTRLAAALAAALLDDGQRIGAEEFMDLAALQGGLANLFIVSGFGSADHVLAHLGTPARATAERSGPGELEAYFRFFALFGLDSQIEVDLAEVLAAPDDLAVLAYAKLLTSKPLATERGHARRERLLDLAGRLPLARLPATVNMLVLLSNAFMHCSYAEHPRKHAVKRTLNAIVRDTMLRLGLTDATLPAVRRLRARPTLVVAAEVMRSNHVQYRYFGQYLRQLRTRFRLVLVTDAREVDEPVRALYDEVFTFERSAGGGYLRAAVEFITATAPDLIFWPSVGMRHWGVALANLRLAPIQITALGHSASTFSPTIDYYLTEAGYVGDPALFSETVVLLPDDSLRFERSPHYEPQPVRIREQATPLRVALPSNLLKLNPRFVRLLERIRAAAGRPLQFHVFPNVHGLELAAARAVLGAALRGVVVHQVLPYNRYVEALGACDLNLSPFPFGGLHSVVDSLRQGLPVVAMECPEPHGRTDSMLLRRLGMPGWLVCHDEEAYFRAALRLIDDDALRVAVSRQAAALDIDRVLFGDAGTPLGTEVVDAVWWIYANHEAIRRDGRRCWPPGSRAA
jgi:hypothetical protein